MKPGPPRSTLRKAAHLIPLSVAYYTLFQTILPVMIGRA